MVGGVRPLVLVIVVTATLSSYVFAGTIDVGIGGGYTYNTIQDGINAAVAEDTVLVHDGTYTGSGNRDIDFVGKGITLVSAGGAASTIIDVQGTELDQHVGFHFHTGETTSSVVDGFTITNGYGTTGPVCGGGIFCDNASPTIRNNIITGNYALYGGGIWNNGGSAHIVNNVIQWNEALHNGGGIVSPSGAPLIEGNLIANNTAKRGGGAYIEEDASHGIIGNTLTGNQATQNGGGLYVSEDDLIKDNLIVGNEAGENGGGIFNWSGMRSENNLIAANSAGTGAGGSGGGIYVYRDARILNTTIVGNTATGSGGGVAFERGMSGIIPYGLLNTIVWDNDASGSGDQVATLDSQDQVELSISFSDVEGGVAGIVLGSGWTLDWGSGNIQFDPLFEGPDDYHLSDASPCLDAGTDKGFSCEYEGQTYYFYAPLDDIEGAVRPFDFPGVNHNGSLPDFDMGAYEAPEPASAALLLLGFSALLCRGKKR